MDAGGQALEWGDVIADLDALQEVEVVHQQKRFLLRSEVRGTWARVAVLNPAASRATPCTKELPHDRLR